MEMVSKTSSVSQLLAKIQFVEQGSADFRNCVNRSIQCGFRRMRFNQLYQFHGDFKIVADLVFNTNMLYFDGHRATIIQNRSMNLSD